MKTVPYSIHVDEDVANHLDRHKKVAGKPDSRGNYVSRAIRAYEQMIDEKQAIKEELREMEQAVNDMRSVARKAYIAKNRFMELFQSALRGEEPKVESDSYALWSKADKELTESLVEEGELR